MGSALFLLYARPRAEGSPRWARPLLAGAAVVLALAAALGFVAQTAMLAGSWTDALTADALAALLGTSLGKAALLRAVIAALAAFLLIAARPGRATWLATAALGTAAAGTLAWMGHAAASESWLHLVSDILHALAAAMWIGALVAFVLLLRDAESPAELAALQVGLRRFSAIGVPLVVLLFLTGLINGWFLVGVQNVLRLPTSPYGQLLLAKLAAFAAMLVLAARNRKRLTPDLEARPDNVSVARLRRNIGIEAALGFAVLGIVAWLGMLAPPAA